MKRDFSIRLPLRISIVVLVAVVLQETIVSQIPIFGINADLTPLVVMSVGLLCGSLTGAVTGFFVGLLIDLALFQTLGISSLLLIAVGYWTGRLNELRPPSHGLVPLLLGALATAFTGLGMAVIQFMLGVDAPVSLLLIEQIIMQVLINSLIALPVYELVRRFIHRALPRAPRRQRVYNNGVLSPLQRPSERAARVSRSAH